MLPLETAVEGGREGGERVSLERQRVNERRRKRRGEKMRGGVALSDGLKNNWLAATREF